MQCKTLVKVLNINRETRFLPMIFSLLEVQEQLSQKKKHYQHIMIWKEKSNLVIISAGNEKLFWDFNVFAVELSYKSPSRWSWEVILLKDLLLKSWVTRSLDSIHHNVERDICHSKVSECDLLEHLLKYSSFCGETS